MASLGGRRGEIRGSEHRPARGLWFFHTFGGVAGGAASAFLAWLVVALPREALPSDIWMGLVLVLLLYFIAADLRLLRRPWTGRQVPATWLRRHGAHRSYFAYGVALGSGLATHVPYALTYGVFVVAASLLPFDLALITGATYGLARTAVVAPMSYISEKNVKLLVTSRASRRLLPMISALLLVSLALAIAL